MPEHLGNRLISWASLLEPETAAQAKRTASMPFDTASYVVMGLENPLSLNASPHGAGRAFSRSAARRQCTGEDLRASMKGIEYRDTDAFIDEMPAAYKDIDRVMADASDLAEIRHTLRQIVNVNGD